MGEPRYDLTVVISYYTPYVSGLTEAARVITEGLAARGWRVALVASQHDPSLPRRERIAGVDVRRTPVIAHIRKGVVSPTFPIVAARLIRQSRVAQLHLPMIEAGIITKLVAHRTPIAVTYQCDMSLPGNFVNRFVIGRIDGASRTAVRSAALLCASSGDYARTSRVLEPYEHKIVSIPPPCYDRSGGQPSYREGPGLHVGFLGRIVEEKGLTYLVEGFRQLDAPDARLLIGGDYESVAGGSVIDEIRRAAGSDDRIKILGFLPDDKLADFYASLDVFALPSVNSLEAFGIVQVEAMLAGVPVIASDRPGMRIPVLETGFGRLVTPRDPDSIHDALAAMARTTTNWSEARQRARAAYGIEATIDAYEKALSELREDTRAGRR